jgi:hypothetical protein
MVPFRLASGLSSGARSSFPHPSHMPSPSITTPHTGGPHEHFKINLHHATGEPNKPCPCTNHNIRNRFLQKHHSQ